MCESRMAQTMKFIEDNIREYLLFEKILGYQYEINQKVAPIYNQKYMEPQSVQTFTNQDLAENTVFDLCARNIEYLFAAKVLLEKKDLHALASTIRPIYESIPKMFYILHHVDETFYIICKDWFDTERAQIEYSYYQRSRSIKQSKILGEFCQKIRQSQFAAKYNTEPETMSKFLNKFSNQYYRDQVYAGDQLQWQNYMYGLLSSHSHANIIRRPEIGSGDTEIRQRYMKILIDLSFFNLYLQVNACWRVLADINAGKETNDIVYELNAEIKNHFEITYLYPKHPEYIKNLVIQPIHKASKKQL